MKFSALLFALACTLAQAAPSPADQDIPDSMPVERRVLSHIGHMRETLSARASELVLNAMGFLGVPYKRGGTDAITGFDCSGFVRNIYEQTVGLVLPRRASEQAQATVKISKDELKPGDLVFFNTMRRAFSHVGIYVGDGKFIHSPHTGSQVRVEDMREAYWTKRFNGARRVLGGELPADVLRAETPTRVE
jgi:cell wall-associated NlpC family hydrolase